MSTTTKRRLAWAAYQMALTAYLEKGIPQTRVATCQRLLVLTSALARTEGYAFRDVRPIVARAMVQALPA